eukprot:6692941-Ditylum_brightwellii.AAC.1
MEKFSQSFAGKAHIALHELLPDAALASLLHQDIHMKCPSSQSHLCDISTILQGMTVWCFTTQGSLAQKRQPNGSCPNYTQTDTDMLILGCGMCLWHSLHFSHASNSSPMESSQTVTSDYPHVLFTLFRLKGTRPPSKFELGATRLAAQADRSGAHTQYLKKKRHQQTRHTSS